MEQLRATVSYTGQRGSLGVSPSRGGGSGADGARRAAGANPGRSQQPAVAGAQQRQLRDRSSLYSSPLHLPPPATLFGPSRPP
eukprot:362405-Chlamydomonas_euryale.AAC.2